jgi:hypothetical protein
MDLDQECLRIAGHRGQSSASDIGVPKWLRSEIDSTFLTGVIMISLGYSVVLSAGLIMA